MWCRRQPALEKIAGEDVDALAVRSYLAHLRADGLAKASMGRHLSALRTFFAFLKREGKVETNPARAIATPRKEHALPRTLSGKVRRIELRKRERGDHRRPHEYREEDFPDLD